MPNTSPTNLRRAMLDAARQCLVEDGYKGLSMRKIARQVGCGVGTIYLYFKNKDDIFHALIDEGFEQLYTAYQAVLTAEADPFDRLEGICRAYVDFGRTQPEYYAIMYMHHPTMVERFPQELYRRARRVLDVTADTLEACAESGRLRLSDPFTEATLLWSAMHGITSLIISQRVDARFDQAELIDQAIQRVIAALQAPQSAPLA